MRGMLSAVELMPLATFEFAYLSIERVDYAVGGQFYGALEGTIAGDRLSGRLQLTNLAQARPDGVNTPTLRGMLTVDDGAVVWVEMDGIAVLREADDARIFLTSVRYRTGTEEYGWLNTVLGVLEGVLDTTRLTARGRLFECRPTDL
jgi:hypothetical protein